MSDDFMSDIPASGESADSKYHDHPGFNQSTANKLLNESPRHAFEYRRLQKLRRGNPDPTHTREREIGTVTHKLLLGSHTSYLEINADDYRTKIAQESRAHCERTGVTPILSCDLEKCVRAANAMREQLKEEFGIEFDGQSEVELYWSEHIPSKGGGSNDLECKAKLDHIRADGVTILDVKTGENANPRTLVRRILDQGYHVQAACYSRALAKNFPETSGKTTFIDLFIETSGLVLCTPVAISGALYELGERQWLLACQEWHQAQQSGYYRGYTDRVLYPECPPWALEQEMKEAL